MQAAQSRKDDPPNGADMFAFFKAPFSVHLTRDFIMQTHDRLKQALKAHQNTAYSHIELFTLLHLLKATLFSVTCCRLMAN